MSSEYLKLMVFLPAILIPTCASSSLAFCVMYSAYKLNKQDENIQPWHTPFLIWNQSMVACPILTVAFWSAYRFLRRQVRWCGIPISLRTRDQIANIHWIIKKAREFQKNISFCFIDYTKAFDLVHQNKLWKILKEMGIRDHLTCLLRNMYAGQEATVWTGHGTTD